MSARPLLVGLGWLDAPGGLERYVADLRGHLGDPPTIVLSAVPDSSPGLVVAASPRSGALRRWWTVRRAAAAAAPRADVLDQHFALTGLAARSSRRARRLPVVVHFHGPWAEEAGGAVWARRCVERWALRGAERTIVLSGAMGRTVIERYRVAPWRVEVVPPGVGLDRFRPGDRSAARQRLSLPTDGFVVVAVRRLVPRTGIAVLLDAWAEAAPRLPAGAQLVVVGDGPQRAELEEQLRRLAPARAARLVGLVGEDALVDHYQAADLAVVPSLALEGFGLAALESLACGTPTLATSCGGLPDAVEGSGLALVPAGDAAALADALVGAAGSRPDAAQCRAHAEQFRWDHVADRHRSLYDAAAARRPPAGRRVAVLDHTAARSGGEIALARMVEASSGARVHAILFEEGPAERLLWAAGATVEVRRLGGPGTVDRAAATRLPAVARHGARTLGFTVALAWRLRRLRPDVVHANSLKAGVIGGLAARAAGVPMVWHVRDRLADDYLPERTARLVRSACRRLAAAVVVPSRAVLDTLGPARPGQERLVLPDPHGCGPARPADRAPGPLRVLMVGRLAPWKGQDVFIRAVAAAFPAGTATASIAGAPLFGAAEEAYAATLERLVDDLGVRPWVSLLGARDDVPALLEQADIVVHASRIPEPFGQVVVEAMAAGAAVIATQGGGPSELLRPDVDGVLVPPDDVDALVAALRTLAEDAPRRARLGASAQARVAALTDPPTVAAALAGLHDRVIAGSDRAHR